MKIINDIVDKNMIGLAETSNELLDMYLEQHIDYMRELEAKTYLKEFDNNRFFPKATPNEKLSSALSSRGMITPKASDTPSSPSAQMRTASDSGPRKDFSSFPSNAKSSSDSLNSAMRARDINSRASNSSAPKKDFSSFPSNAKSSSDSLNSAMKARDINSRAAPAPAKASVASTPSSSATNNSSAAAPKAKPTPTPSSPSAQMKGGSDDHSSDTPPLPKAKPAVKKGMTNFEKAFSSARKSGKSNFRFGGKLYNTKLK